MSENFGLRIGLEGEREFKKALSDINASFKVLGSEMTLVSSQFDKNDRSVQALTSRNEVLNREIEAQKQKIETLRAALDNAASSFGENDRRTQNWQIQLNKAQAELNGMERELGENNKALDSAETNLDEAGKEAKQFGKEIDKAGDQSKDAGSKFQKAADIAGKVGAAMAASVAAIGAAAIAAGKQLWDMANDVASAGDAIDKTEDRHIGGVLSGVELRIRAFRSGRERTSERHEEAVGSHSGRCKRLGFSGGKARSRGT